MEEPIETLKSLPSLPSNRWHQWRGLLLCDPLDDSDDTNTTHQSSSSASSNASTAANSEESLSLWLCIDAKGRIAQHRVLQEYQSAGGYEKRTKEIHFTQTFLRQSSNANASAASPTTPSSSPQQLSFTRSKSIISPLVSREFTGNVTVGPHEDDSHLITWKIEGTFKSSYFVPSQSHSNVNVSVGKRVNGSISGGDSRQQRSNGGSFSGNALPTTKQRLESVRTGSFYMEVHAPAPVWFQHQQQIASHQLQQQQQHQQAPPSSSTSKNSRSRGNAQASPVMPTYRLRRPVTITLPTEELIWELCPDRHHHHLKSQQTQLLPQVISLRFEEGRISSTHDLIEGEYQDHPDAVFKFVLNLTNVGNEIHWFEGSVEYDTSSSAGSNTLLQASHPVGSSARAALALHHVNSYSNHTSSSAQHDTSSLRLRGVHTRRIINNTTTGDSTDEFLGGVMMRIHDNQTVLVGAASPTRVMSPHHLNLQLTPGGSASNPHPHTPSSAAALAAAASPLARAKRSKLQIDNSKRGSRDGSRNPTAPSTPSHALSPHHQQQQQQQQHQHLTIATTPPQHVKTISLVTSVNHTTLVVTEQKESSSASAASNLNEQLEVKKFAEEDEYPDDTIKEQEEKSVDTIAPSQSPSKIISSSSSAATTSSIDPSSSSDSLTSLASRYTASLSCKEKLELEQSRKRQAALATKQHMLELDAKEVELRETNRLERLNEIEQTRREIVQMILEDEQRVAQEQAELEAQKRQELEQKEREYQERLEALTQSQHNNSYSKKSTMNMDEFNGSGSDSEEQTNGRQSSAIGRRREHHIEEAKEQDIASPPAAVLSRPSSSTSLVLHSANNATAATQPFTSPLLTSSVAVLKNHSALGLLPHLYDLLSSSSTSIPFTIPFTLIFSSEGKPEASYVSSDADGVVVCNKWNVDTSPKEAFGYFERNVAKNAPQQQQKRKSSSSSVGSHLAALVHSIDGSLPSVPLRLLEVGSLLKNGLKALGGEGGKLREYVSGAKTSGFIVQAFVFPPASSSPSQPIHHTVYRCEFSHNGSYFQCSRRIANQTWTADAANIASASSSIQHRLATYKSSKPSLLSYSTEESIRLSHNNSSRLLPTDEIFVRLRKTCLGLIRKLNEKGKKERVQIHRLCVYLQMDDSRSIQDGPIHMLYGDRMDLRVDQPIEQVLNNHQQATKNANENVSKQDVKKEEEEEKHSDVADQNTAASSE